VIELSALRHTDARRSTIAGRFASPRRRRRSGEARLAVASSDVADARPAGAAAGAGRRHRKAPRSCNQVTEVSKEFTAFPMAGEISGVFLD
jgi:hypothetical protein